MTQQTKPEAGAAPWTAPAIACRAAELVGGDRANDHGPMARNFANIAGVWNALLRAAGVLTDGRELDGVDVANLMEGLKLARRYSGRVNLDDFIDGAGYAAVAGELAQRAEQA